MLKNGCATEVTNVFGAKHKLKITRTVNDGSRVTLQEVAEWGGRYVNIDAMYGDCTAATLYTGGLSFEDFKKWLPIIQEYLSINARINCFATRMCHGRNAAEQLIAFLKDAGCKKISVNIGNRDQDPDHFQVSFNIKVPVPLIRSYSSATVEQLSQEHDHMDFTAYNKLQKSFGLYIKEGK